MTINSLKIGFIGFFIYGVAGGLLLQEHDVSARDITGGKVILDESGCEDRRPREHHC